MHTDRKFDTLSRRDQRWLQLGLSFGAFLKRLFGREDIPAGTTTCADA